MGRLRRYIRWADGRQDLDPLGQVPSVPPVRLGAALAAQRGHLLGSRWVERRLETRVCLHDLCARGPGLQPGEHSLRLDGPRHDQVPEERARLAAFRSMGSGATVLMLAWVVAPQIKRYVGNPAGFQQSLTFTTGIFVIVGFLLFLFTFLTCKEQVQRDVTSVSLKQSMATLKTNMPLMMLCGTALLAITGTTGFSTVGAYYSRDVLLNANLFIWITLVNTGVIFIVAPLMPTIVHTIGKRNGYLIGGMLGIIGGVGMAFAPGLVIALIWAGIMGVGVAMLNTLMWALEADTVEYGEWKTGVRTEGTTYALFSFTRKLGQAFGGAAAAFTPRSGWLYFSKRRLSDRKRAVGDQGRLRFSSGRIVPSGHLGHVLLSAHRKEVPRDGRRSGRASR